VHSWRTHDAAARVVKNAAFGLYAIFEYKDDRRKD